MCLNSRYVIILHDYFVNLEETGAAPRTRKIGNHWAGYYAPGLCRTFSSVTALSPFPLALEPPALLSAYLWIVPSPRHGQPQQPRSSLPSESREHHLRLPWESFFTLIWRYFASSQAQTVIHSKILHCATKWSNCLRICANEDQVSEKKKICKHKMIYTHNSWCKHVGYLSTAQNQSQNASPVFLNPKPCLDNTRHCIGKAGNVLSKAAQCEWGFEHRIWRWSEITYLKGDNERDRIISCIASSKASPL